MSAISSISGAQRHARFATRWSRSAGTPSASSCSVYPVGPRDRLGLKVSAIPILFQPPKAILRCGGGADSERPARSPLPHRSGKSSATLLGSVSGEVEIDAAGRDDRAVDDVRPDGRDPPHPLGEIAFASTKMPSKPRSKTCRATSSANAGGQIESTISLSGRARRRSRTSLKPAARSPRRLAPAVARPDDLRQDGAPTAAPISPG